MDARLDTLLAKQDIYEVLVRYCRGVDRCDEDMVRAAYHEDSFDDHGYWKGTGHEFAGFITTRLREANRATLHSITNVLIEVDGGTARAESHVYASMLRHETDPQVVDMFMGRYLDRFERRAGRWAISERTVVMDWCLSHVGGMAEGWPVPMDDYARGERHPHDPSSAFLQRED